MVGFIRTNLKWAEIEAALKEAVNPPATSIEEVHERFSTYIHENVNSFRRFNLGYIRKNIYLLRRRYENGDCDWAIDYSDYYPNVFYQDNTNVVNPRQEEAGIEKEIRRQETTNHFMAVIYDHKARTAMTRKQRTQFRARAMWHEAQHAAAEAEEEARREEA